MTIENRSVYRDPMVMTIDFIPKQYEDKIYYQYYIDKLCLQSEIKKYEIMYNKTHEAIKQFKQNSKSIDVCETNDFREIDEPI